MQPTLSLFFKGLLFIVLETSVGKTHQKHLIRGGEGGGGGGLMLCTHSDNCFYLLILINSRGQDFNRLIQQFIQTTFGNRPFDFFAFKHPSHFESALVKVTDRNTSLKFLTLKLIACFNSEIFVLSLSMLPHGHSPQPPPIVFPHPLVGRTYPESCPRFKDLIFFMYV